MNNPDLQKWLLAPDGIATRLRQLRGATTGKAFAELVGMRAARLSKLELAQQEPTADDIRAIVAAAGQPDTLADELVAKLADTPTVRVSARINRFGPVATQRRLNQIYAASGHIQSFDPMYLPRPLQTLDYATAVMSARALVNGTKDESAEAAAEIVASGEYLRDYNRQFDMVIAESALRWQILPAAQMRAQLEQLSGVLGRQNVNVWILPLDRHVPVPAASGFVIADLRGYSDSLEASTELTDGRLEGHIALMNSLSKASARGAAAATLVKAALGRLGTAVHFTDGQTS